MTSAIVKALSVLVGLAVLVKSTKGLSCVPCYEVTCPRGNLTESDCPFGVVKNVCRCCDACAKGPGQKCGGLFGWHGTCGRNFTCLKNDSNYPYHFYQEEGICVYIQF